MNWYNLVKNAISFNKPGRHDDALQRVEEMDDSGNIPDEAINNLLNDIGYPQQRALDDPTLGEEIEKFQEYYDALPPAIKAIERIPEHLKPYINIEQSGSQKSEMTEEWSEPEQEEWSEPEDRPWDWEPPKPSIIEKGQDPQLESMMRRMDEAVDATAVPKRVKQIIQTMPDFKPNLDNIYSLMERVASEIQGQTEGLPKDDISKMMVVERLQEIIPQLFGKTMEELEQEGFSEGETGFVDIDF